MPTIDTTELHTADRPYCDDLACWCHSSVAHHLIVTDPLAQTPPAQELAAAYDFFGVKGATDASR